MIFHEEHLPVPSVTIDDASFYTAAQLARALGCPEWVIIDRCRQGHFAGRKLGLVYLVDAESFIAWIRLGRFEFNPRVRSG